MRTTLSLFCLLALLAFSAPRAQAQLRSDLGGPAPAAVYEDADASNGFGQRMEDLMRTLFDDDHFRMSHSYEMSASTFGGGTSLGMYTNSMQWQFGSAWAARVDMSVAHQPFGGGGGALGEDGRQMRVFLRNAEIAYRPNENMTFHFRMSQSPYGRYAGPYGRAFGQPAGFGYGGALAPPPGQRGGLFWNPEQRN